jgi:hypothetical protein
LNRGHGTNVRPETGEEKTFLGPDTKIEGLYNTIVGPQQEGREVGFGGPKLGAVAKELDPRSVAIATQLRAEIAGSPYKKIAPFARALDEVVKTDPTTFFNRVSGKSPMPMETLFAALDLLGLDFDTFVKRAMERLERPQD